MGSLGRYMRRNTASLCAWFFSKKKLAQKVAGLTADVHHKKQRIVEEQNNVDRATYANQSLSEKIRQLQLELITARDEIAVLRARVDLMNIAYGHNRQLVIQAISTAGGPKDVDRKSLGFADDGELAG